MKATMMWVYTAKNWHVRGEAARVAFNNHKKCCGGKIVRTLVIK
jgi:hypothetical protein